MVDKKHACCLLFSISKEAFKSSSVCDAMNVLLHASDDSYCCDRTSTETISRLFNTVRSPEKDVIVTNDRPSISAD